MFQSADLGSHYPDTQRAFCDVPVLANPHCCSEAEKQQQSDLSSFLRTGELHTFIHIIDWDYSVLFYFFNFVLTSQLVIFMYLFVYLFNGALNIFFNQ